MAWHLPVEVRVDKVLLVSYWEVVEGVSLNPRCSTDVHGCGLLCLLSRSGWWASQCVLGMFSRSLGLWALLSVSI